MRFGYVSMNSASGMQPAPLARELEARGFESFWVPEHSHIPVSRASPFPSGGELPTGYLHMMSPFVALAAAGAVTERLLLGTAVCLVLQHDLIDLALQTATLDVISGGRLRLGIGVGWNAEELANHRPELRFAKRSYVYCGIEVFRVRDGRIVEIWNSRETGGHWQPSATP